MTVKKLTAAQKDAVITVFDSKTRTLKQIAEFLGVSTRTIGRVLDERGVTGTMAQRSSEAKQVMALLYKHKVTVDQLEDILNDLTAGQLQYISGYPVAYQTKKTKKSPSGHTGKQSMLPLSLPTSLELH